MVVRCFTSGCEPSLSHFEQMSHEAISRAEATSAAAASAAALLERHRAILVELCVEEVDRCKRFLKATPHAVRPNFLRTAKAIAQNTLAEPYVAFLAGIEPTCMHTFLLELGVKSGTSELQQIFAPPGDTMQTSSPTASTRASLADTVVDVKDTPPDEMDYASGW